MRPSSAAQCVAYVACAELPANLWPDLINHLTENVTNPSSTEMMKESSLETIGYICQDIVSSIIHIDIHNSLLVSLVAQQILFVEALECLLFLHVEPDCFKMISHIDNVSRNLVSQYCPLMLARGWTIFYWKVIFLLNKSPSFKENLLIQWDVVVTHLI